MWRLYCILYKMKFLVTANWIPVFIYIKLAVNPSNKPTGKIAYFSPRFIAKVHNITYNKFLNLRMYE